MRRIGPTGQVQQVRIVLASRSPRRIELLGRLGVECEVVPADIDETPLPGETAQEMVLRLSIGKATVVAERHRDSTVLAADTTVEIDDEILGQPVDDADAARMLRRLSGRPHRVHTPVAGIDPAGPAPRTARMCCGQPCAPRVTPSCGWRAPATAIWPGNWARSCARRCRRTATCNATRVVP